MLAWQAHNQNVMQMDVLIQIFLLIVYSLNSTSVQLLARFGNFNSPLCILQHVSCKLTFKSLLGYVYKDTKL